MSAKKHVIVSCDGDGCERVFRGQPDETLSHVRLMAYGMDWHHDRRRGKDYCPLHDPRRLVAALSEGA